MSMFSKIKAFLDSMKSVEKYIPYKVKLENQRVYKGRYKDYPTAFLGKTDRFKHRHKIGNYKKRGYQ